MDTEAPVFSNPTDITNPLFPISDLAQVIQLGTEAGDTLRVEITLLPETRMIEIDGNQVEAVVSQYVAYGGGRIVEVALDFYAQADDGSVWYLGEEVDNYDDGEIADNEGTWLAGSDGPPGMIMPADPQVGDVFHPENIPDLVYETVTVLEADQTVDGPRGLGRRRHPHRGGPDGRRDRAQDVRPRLRRVRRRGGGRAGDRRRRRADRCRDRCGRLRRRARAHRAFAGSLRPSG